MAAAAVAAPSESGVAAAAASLEAAAPVPGEGALAAGAEAAVGRQQDGAAERGESGQGDVGIVCVIYMLSDGSVNVIYAMLDSITVSSMVVPPYREDGPGRRGRLSTAGRPRRSLK